MTMWSSQRMDLKNVNLVLNYDQPSSVGSDFKPTPYTFTKLENGKKKAVDSNSLIPPSWLLLDHTIAVIWSIFSLNPPLQQLNIDDLKWAHEFLREIKNNKGENPPDVKACLEEIQERLINLYAKLTSLKEEDFDEIAAAFSEKIMFDEETDSDISYPPVLLTSGKIESKSETTTLAKQSNFMVPSKIDITSDVPSLFHSQSNKDLFLGGEKRTSKHKRIAMNYSKKTFPLLESDSNIFEERENTESEEVEKYFLRLFEDEKKEDVTETKTKRRSFIPTKRKNPSGVSFPDIMSSKKSSGDLNKKEKTSKKVHCVAEMRSLKFQKSMKVQDVNGEEAAYSNLKAEIRRLTINPNVSKTEIMKFLKEWRSEQVERLHNELKRLSSIEEFMKNVNTNGVEPNLRKNSSQKLKELETSTKSNYSLCANSTS